MSSPEWVFPSDSECARRLRAVDWSQTPLGPTSGWPPSLRTALEVVYGAPQPTLLCWGPESVLFYNDATARQLGARHPAALGARGVDAFGLRWKQLGAAVRRVTATRSSADLEAPLLPWADDGAPRAACLRVTLLPLMDEAFAVGGVLGLATEIAGPGREEPLGEASRAPAPARSLGTAATAEAHEGRVLFVDDNADMRRYVTDVLEPRFAVETCVDGISALEAARAAPPDVVLADVMMPGIDGFTLVRALRAEEGTRAVPVILCSARGDEDAKVEALGAGATDYLVKPVGVRELFARVEAAVKAGRAAAARLKEQDRLRAILDHAPAAICLLDGPEHRFTMANERYLEFMGLRDVLGKTVAEALPEVVEQGFVALLDTVFRTGEPFLGTETPVKLKSADGSGLQEVRVNFIFQPVKDTAGQTEFIFIHVVDVTELVHAREREAALARAAEARAGFEQQLIGIVSHDLRDPLGAIGFSAQALLRNKSLDLRAFETVTRLRSSTERAQRMVSDLLDFTQVRLGGGLPTNPRPLDLAPFLRQVCEEVQTNHPDRLLVVQADGPCPGELDPDRIAQVVVNLLGNALKYGEPAVPVTLRLDDLGQSMRLRVHNGGPPIPPDLEARLFEPMQRGSMSMEAGGRSVGLGLYITRHIVQAHGGTIGVTSTEAEGTTFTVTLPRRAQVQDERASATN